MNVNVAERHDAAEDDNRDLVKTIKGSLSMLITRPTVLPEYCEPLLNTDDVREVGRAGGRDEIVPPAITRKGMASGGELVVVADYDHRCCWVTLWPDILAKLDREHPPTAPRR